MHEDTLEHTVFCNITPCSPAGICSALQMAATGSSHITELLPDQHLFIVFQSIQHHKWSYLHLL